MNKRTLLSVLLPASSRSAVVIAQATMLKAESSALYARKPAIMEKGKRAH